MGMGLTCDEIGKRADKAVRHFAKTYIEKDHLCVHEGAAITSEASALLLANSVHNLKHEDGEVKAVQWLSEFAMTLTGYLHEAGICADVKFSVVHREAPPKAK